MVRKRETERKKEKERDTHTHRERERERERESEEGKEGDRQTDRQEGCKYTGRERQADKPERDTKGR